jgi:DAK2 domain fusion protein YloV
MNKEVKTIDIKTLKEMFINGAKLIADNYEYIDELNVFPVPDGDTGSNMKATTEGAIEYIKKDDFADLLTFGKAYARGLLMNARGNSGVIFSQIFKGFVMNYKEGQKEITCDEVIDCFVSAKEVAYRAVSQPVEGTILTVIRVISEKMIHKKGTYTSMEKVFSDAIVIGEDALAKTPDLLPALKEVGVVDSGGYGLMKFISGMKDILTGNVGEKQKEKKINPAIDVKKSFLDNYNDDNEGFGYCNEFIMTLNAKVTLSQKAKEPFDLLTFKKGLSKLGDSDVVVQDGDIVKVHIHSTKPYEILQYGARFGEFNKIKVENMTNQFLERNPGTSLETMAMNKKNKVNSLLEEVRVVATVQSEELTKIYSEEFNIKNTIDTSINGNPSIQEFLKQVKETKSKNVIIVVDDSNVILAAKQAIELLDGIKCELIITKDAITSYLACLAFDPIVDIKKNVKNMSNAILLTKAGYISKSIKPVKYSHINVKKDDFIGIIDKKIVSSNKNFKISSESLITQVISYIRKPKIAYIMAGLDMNENEIN